MHKNSHCIIHVTFVAFFQKIRRHSEVCRPEPERLRRGDALRHHELHADGGAEGHSVPASLVAVVHLGIRSLRPASAANCITRLVCDCFCAQREILDISVT